MIEGRETNLENISGVLEFLCVCVCKREKERRNRDKHTQTETIILDNF